MAVQYYVASSLDGFIATPDDDVSWLDSLPQPNPETYTEFIDGVGAIVMGSATYRFLLKHMAAGNPWPYDLPCWVFSRQYLAPAHESIRVVSGAVANHMEAIFAAAGAKHVWVVGGGDLAGQFMDAGLLDELIVNVASITLGAGKPLLPRQATLERIATLDVGPGFVELRYRIANASE